MDEEKKEKLEKELQFLKDSLTSSIISQEEYNRGESRIQNQLDEVEEEASESEAPDAEVKELSPDEVSPVAEAETPDVPDEVAEEVTSLPDSEPADSDASDELKDKDIAESVVETEPAKEQEIPEAAESEPAENVVEEPAAEKEETKDEISEDSAANVVESEPAKEQEIVEEVKDSEPDSSVEPSKEITPEDLKEPEVAYVGADSEKTSEKVKAGENEVPLSEEKKTELPADVRGDGQRSSFGTYVVILLVIGAGLFLLLKGNPFGDSQGEQERPIELLTSLPAGAEPECYRDSDCSKDKMIARCENAGTEDASCVFEADVEVHLTIVNGSDCVLCDSSRMEQTLREVFPNLIVTRLSFDSEEGMDLALLQELPLLPAYFIASGVEEAARFDLFARALEAVENGYLVGPKASGASYFIGREESPRLLTVFVTSDVRDRVRKNVQPVLDLFESDITFTERLGDSSALAAEFAVSTYPTFIVNNKVRFSGIHSAEKIKENYCLLNALAGCGTTLTSTIS